MQIISTEQRSVTRHFLKIKLADATPVPAGPDYVSGTEYVPEMIEASWHEGKEPESVKITGTIVAHYGRHHITNGYKLDRLPIELEYVRKLVADALAE